jgi:hypothetical protein
MNFLSEILQYDRNIANIYGNGLFTETEEDGETVILAEYLALLVKTYFDLDTVSMEMLFHNISKKWKDSQSLHRMLGNIPNDLSLRLFVVAFHSEYLSNKVGDGYYYPLFRCIHLNNYIFVQRVMYETFNMIDSSTWIPFLKEIQREIKKKMLIQGS